MAGHRITTLSKNVSGDALKCPFEKGVKILFVMYMFCVWIACA